MTWPTLIDLNPDEYNQVLQYYLFMINLDRCKGSLDDISGKICVSNKPEDVKVSAFNVIARINELRTLTKYISCERKCACYGKKCNSNQNWNSDKCRYECKNPRKNDVCAKDDMVNPSICTCKNGKCLESIIGDSVITCDEIIEVTKNIPIKTISTIYNEKKLTRKNRKKANP